VGGQRNDDTNDNGRTTAGVLLENQLLRLFVSAFFDQTTLLAGVIDESLEAVSTESDTRFEEFRRLRTLYRSYTDEPDEAQLAAIFDELSDARKADADQT
jgi:hypothetical protein